MSRRVPLDLHLNVKMSYSPSAAVSCSCEGTDEQIKSEEQKAVCDLGGWSNESEKLSRYQNAKRAAAWICCIC